MATQRKSAREGKDQPARRGAKSRRPRTAAIAAGRFNLPVTLGTAVLTFALGLLIILPFGCSQTANTPSHSMSAKPIRVRLLANVEQAQLTAADPPAYHIGTDATVRTLGLPRNATVAVALTPHGWKMGQTLLGSGVLYIAPASEGSVSINGLPYRGQYRFVPVSATRFDVVNDVNIDAYIAGVLPRELPAGWHQETYRAEAIVARTFALYEHEMARDRYWDVYPDQRSQMYGGLAAESAKSRDAATYTSGVVVAYGPPGQEHIFKAYFSSCCGGITQSATDAFGDKYIEPLSDQNTKGICNASPRFNWGPMVIRKDELCRRFKLYGLHKGSPLKDLQGVADVQIQAQNVWGRPVRFQVTDTRGTRYSLSGEEFRWAVNSDADHDAAGLDKQGQLTILWSSFVKVICDADSVRFVEGHGWGHGVGMCQWCAERRAEEGMRHEDIVLAAYQRATLVRAY